MTHEFGNPICRYEPSAPPPPYDHKTLADCTRKGDRVPAFEHDAPEGYVPLPGPIDVQMIGDLRAENERLRARVDELESLVLELGEQRP